MSIEQSYQYEQSEKIGKFKNDLNKRHFNKIFKRIKHYFINQNWDLGDRKFKDQSAKQFFKSLIEVKGIALWIDYNKNPSIMKQIAQPLFVSLQTIYLGDNNIHSLQDLSALNIPRIRHISLNDNLISNVKSFRKCNFTQLQYISLNGNRISNYEGFQKTTFKRLSKLMLLDQIVSINVWQNTNVFWMVKTSMPRETAQVFFYSKFITTPQLSLIKVKIRVKNCLHPCLKPNSNTNVCSPLPLSD